MRVKLSLRKVLFIVVFLLGIIVFQNNVKATTVADLRAKFPAGKFWNHYAGSDHNYWDGIQDSGSCNNPDGFTNEQCLYHNGTTAGYGKPDCNSFDGGQECVGFARKLFFDYYGVYATSRTKTYDKNSIKPGDVVRYTGGGAASGGHEVWVIGVDNEKLIVAECNYYKPCEISWDRWVYKNNINISYIYPAPYAINDNQTPSTPSTPSTPATVKVSSIKLSSTAITLTKTQSRGLVATVYPSNATNKALTWSSSNTSVATVSSTGNIKAVGKGTATITAKAKDGSGVTKTCKVTVNYAEPNVLYSSHVQNIGWQGYVSNGAMSGTSGQSLRLEAMKIKLDSQYSGGISYSTHVQNIGWQGAVSNNSLSGTSGQGLRLEAIKINLYGEISNYYDIYYRVHAQNFGWLGWAKNGQEAGTAGYGYRLESIQIKLVKKGASAPGSTANIYKAKSTVSYTTHVQDIGWQNYFSNGAVAGTTGRSLRLEGIKIQVNSPYSGGITYSTHVQNIGWQNYVSNNAMSGTSGKSLRLEAIKINLTGELANQYDIYYRVHAENYGWLGWAKNGQEAGTEGFAYRLEGIQIVLVEKGGSAPGSTSNRFVKKTSY